MKYRFSKFCFLICISFNVVAAVAQTVPVGMPVLDDYYRRLQLDGKIDSSLSFSVWPIYPVNSLKAVNAFDPDGSLQKDNWISNASYSFAGGKGLFQVLPITINQQYNSDHPYGWNDGLMIPAKGYQTLVSAGVFLKLGPLSVQFRPEFDYAINNSFNGFASGHGDNDLVQYYGYHNLIDQPERFGTGSYKKSSLGQSSVRLTFGGISFGLSNENLWWGPGINNALIITNNAPGFKHATLNTVRPLKTVIGSFEGQIIAARLDGTNQPGLNVTSTSAGQSLYLPPRNDWRYYTGFNLNYQPKWLPGLFLGFIRTFNAYHSDIHRFSGYFPFLTPFQKESTLNAEGDEFPRDQVTSLYARWLFTKAKAELYFEYGLNDNSYNYLDFFGSPEHSRAYIFGLRKLIPINSSRGDAILFGAEIDQLSQSADRLVRGAGGWYIHTEVMQGQTNEGQILGAGTGSGGNLQNVNVSWVRGLKKIGFSLERYEHDVDYSESVFFPINGNNRKWVDFAVGALGNWNYKNLLFNVKIQAVKSLNYEWILKDYNPSDSYYIPHNDVFNLHTELGVTYRF